MASSSLFLIFFFFLFPLLFISHATVPPSDTFRYVNSGAYGDSEETQTEYDPTYRPLPPFTTPFQLCFYNNTPNAYTLGLRMGLRRDRSLKRWVWEANRGNPVRENATFSFGSDGNMVLADADGRIAWQTNTANKGVVGFAILSNGNMVLRDAKGNFIWQSFDSPTDTILFGQSLQIGGPNKLVSRASTTENVNGVYSFVLEPKRLALYYKTMRYWSSTFTEVNKVNGNLVNATLEIAEAEYSDSNFNALRCRLSNNGAPTLLLDILRYNSTLSYLRLGIDGNLRLYSYRQNTNAAAWSLLFTWFNRGSSERGENIEDECQLPNRCGNFGLCEDSQCVGCPTPNGVVAWSKDCAAKVPGCDASGFRYYELKGVDHFTVKYSAGTGPVKRSDCESKCTKDCKCLGYFYHTDRSRCWIAYELKTLTRVGESSHMAYIKTPIR
ncbi:epidermis-specific secreted glycoprotein EP1-like [Cynara cardunculus var. scolymus]|uniref:epidermis-specific secreted glycoprotein EP1-like n=1 Tax=Cynara cardunculus var. scolymus TaxID=59895 RepID=UPI000D62D02E|nr:epidermis-specific secreted glycoprotein EP1-like [Cynara cardunculus var. scolymus]